MIRGKTFYRGFIIYKYKAHNTRTHWRVYQGEEFKQTSDNLKDATRLIDFCVNNGIWNERL